MHFNFNRNVPICVGVPEVGYWQSPFFQRGKIPVLNRSNVIDIYVEFFNKLVRFYSQQEIFLWLQKFYPLWVKLNSKLTNLNLVKFFPIRCLIFLLISAYSFLLYTPQVFHSFVIFFPRRLHLIEVFIYPPWYVPYTPPYARMLCLYS